MTPDSRAKSSTDGPAVLTRAMQMDWHVVLAVVACTAWIVSQMSAVGAAVRGLEASVSQLVIYVEKQDQRIRAIEAMSADRGPRIHALEEIQRRAPR